MLGKNIDRVLDGHVNVKESSCHNCLMQLLCQIAACYWVCRIRVGATRPGPPSDPVFSPNVLQCSYDAAGENGAPFERIQTSQYRPSCDATPAFRPGRGACCGS